MKKPLLLLGSDPHLKESNLDQVKDLFGQLFDKARELGLNEVYLGGDIYDGRKAQPLENLIAWDNILANASLNQIEIRAIAGNHDKKDYTSTDSYLTISSHHPSLNLIETFGKHVHGDISVYMCPFFEEKGTYSKYLEDVSKDKSKYKILITHVGVDGVRNNDGSEVENQLSQDIFKQFDLVLVGHYHNRSRLGEIIHYIGSMAQKDHGESVEKGFCLVYDDLSIEYIQSDFKRYETVEIDLDTIDQKEFNKIKKKYTDHKDNIKFKITGEESKCKSINKRDIEDLGIKVSMKYKDVEAVMSKEDALTFTGFDGGEIMSEWGIFSDESEIDRKFGEELLKKAIG